MCVQLELGSIGSAFAIIATFTALLVLINEVIALGMSRDASTVARRVAQAARWLDAAMFPA